MTTYLVFDTESVPDGKLLNLVKYTDRDFSEEEAIDEAKKEALENSGGRTDFLSPVFQYPVALCLIKVADDYSIEDLVLLDQPHYRPGEIAKGFWKGLSRYDVPIVSFNGRGFDLPLMELAAFRYGISVPYYFRAGKQSNMRYRYGDKHLDLMEWLTNFGALRQGYSLNLFSKLLGKPGKMETKGSDVYDMFLKGQIQEINEYCSYDVLDTYFLLLRYLVLTGEINTEREQDIVKKAKEWVQGNLLKYPFLELYLKNWGDWSPWP